MSYYSNSLLMLKKAALGLLLAVLLDSCQSPDTLFEQLSSSKTNVEFNNVLEESDDFNVLKYGYFFNGGGVAAGDFNNDGFIDLFFTGNIRSNKLYLNLGKNPSDTFEFEDITEEAGVGAADGWNTGASVVDINNDGWLDIYVCRSAANNPTIRRNLLFINNGKLADDKVKFTERAAEYGLNNDGYSTQATFFDYDRDGDLDCFLLNHSVQQYAGFSRMIADYKQQNNPAYSSKLYRNEIIDSTGTKTNQTKMTEVTQASGLISNVLSFGLGVSITDVNNDGWMDIYVSNDYNENDYLYINQQKDSNGKVTFKESIRESMGHTSLYSMGTDAADFNNDGLVDIVTIDMLPNRNERIKLTSGDDNYDKYQMLVNAGFHHQTSRNMLQLNNGNLQREKTNIQNLNTKQATPSAIPSFSEVGQLSGISNTDWSWSVLFADFDNDGFKDLFITNGYARDYTNMEFLKYSTDMQIANQQSGKVPTQMEIIEKMPSINESNCIFRNKGDLTFEKRNTEWGFDHNNQSNGAIYTDLDNDGDLDLVVNNVNEKAGIYRNNSQEKSPQNYITIDLKNTTEAHKIGAKVIVFTKEGQQMQEFQPVRGFQSAMYGPLHFGLGKTAKVDSIKVIWTDGNITSLKEPKVNQKIMVDYGNGSFLEPKSLFSSPLFSNASSLFFTHKIAPINDFKIQTLLPEMKSGVGPCMAIGDVNGDGKEDVYIGGGRGQAGGFFLQTATGFSKSPQSDFEKDAAFEDANAVLFDADNDKDLDLVVVSAGYALNPKDSLLKPRLYFNQNGKFTKASVGAKPSDAFNTLLINATTVATADIDTDGDQDVFIGAHCTPGRYPESQPSVLLQNDGKGNYSVIRSFTHSSLVTGAVFTDLNGDKKPDLLLVGEWMKPTAYLNRHTKWVENKQITQTLASSLAHSLYKSDLDNDGDEDFIVGNMGLNTQYHVTSGDKLKMYAKDFSENGGMLPLVTIFENGKEYPYASRDELLDQIPVLKKKYPDYLSYSTATLTEMLETDQLQSATQATAEELRTGILWNENGKLVFKPLPLEAQFAPVYAIEVADLNKDGKNDIILGGNLDRTRVRLGKIDANRGQVFLNLGKQQFSYLSQAKSGLDLSGEVRSARLVGPYLLFGINNQAVQTYRLPLTAKF